MAKNGVGVLCLFLGGLCGSALGVVTIRCEPVDTTPNGHDVVQYDCMLSTDVALSLNAYQIALPCTAAPDVGATGTIDHFRINATSCTFAGPDSACLFDGFQATCTNTQVCFFPADCGANQCLPDPQNPGVSYCQNVGTCQDPSPFIQTNRPDYVFGGQSGVTVSTSPGNCPSTRPTLGANMPPTQGVNLDGASGEKYIGSYRYRVSNCAAGIFTVIVQGHGNPPALSDLTHVGNAAGQAVLVSPMGGVVTVESGLCCNALSCLGNHNAYCCLNVQGGSYSDATMSCSGPNPDPCICTQNSHCNDNSVCTDDSCDPNNPLANQNGCVLAPNYPAGNCCNPANGQLDPLNDNNPCTVDTCQGGTYPAVHNATAANGFVCQDDGNTCTFDYCDAGACTHPNKAFGTACSPDGVFCTWDVCDNGACTHPTVSSISCMTVANCPPLASACTSGFCVCNAPSQPCWGDIVPPGGDGYCQLDDLLCCLDGYSTFSLCPQADLAPCGGDGIVELADILKVLDGYALIPSCGANACLP